MELLLNGTDSRFREPHQIIYCMKISPSKKNKLACFEILVTDNKL